MASAFPKDFKTHYNGAKKPFFDNELGNPSIIVKTLDLINRLQMPYREVKTLRDLIEVCDEAKKVRIFLYK